MPRRAGRRRRGGRGRDVGHGVLGSWPHGTGCVFQ
jgi:hypothetical protein